jgi:co-chaperonin GroES (HSP10)
MKTLIPLRDNVIGRMLEPIGKERSTKAGLVLTERNFGEETIRNRWFEVTHIGPDQESIKLGDYVLVPHGRWSRGVDLEGTMREDDKLFLLDNDAMLMLSDELPD